MRHHIRCGVRGRYCNHGTPERDGAEVLVVPMALTEKDLFDIQENLWDARSKWRNIGLAIKIRNPDLEVIDQENRDIDAKFQSMILLWLKNGKDCTWATLCKALEARSVGLSDLAARIRSEKCVGEGVVQ